MGRKLEDMTYIEFFRYCNDRACDGQWGLEEALACTSIISEIESIKVRGFFKRKKTKLVKQLAWEKIISGL